MKTFSTRFQDRHIIPVETSETDRQPIVIDSKISLLFLAALKRIAGKECAERLDEMYEKGYWMRVYNDLKF